MGRTYFDMGREAARKDAYWAQFVYADDPVDEMERILDTWIVERKWMPRHTIVAWAGGEPVAAITNVCVECGQPAVDPFAHIKR